MNTLRTNLVTKILLSLLFCCVVEVDAQTGQPPPSAAELRSWPDAPLIRSARRGGIDYPHVLDRAVAGDAGALATLFRFTDTGWIDGAAGEGHAAILFALLQRWGDKPFARVLRAQKRTVRKAVCNEVEAFPEFGRAQFPMTYASGRH